MPAGDVLKLLRPLYGLADSGAYWNVTFSHHLKDELEMSTVKSDISLFFRHVRGKLAGLVAKYVDDTLSCGTRHLLSYPIKPAKDLKSRTAGTAR